MSGSTTGNTLVPIVKFATLVVKIMDFKFDLENALSPILVTLLGIVIKHNLDVALFNSSFANANSPIVSRVEFASNVTIVNPVAFKNALSPIIVTLLGISIEDNPVLANIPMLMTVKLVPSSNVTVVKL